MLGRTASGVVLLLLCLAAVAPACWGGAEREVIRVTVEPRPTPAPLGEWRYVLAGQALEMSAAPSPTPAPTRVLRVLPTRVPGVTSSVDPPAGEGDLDAGVEVGPLSCRDRYRLLLLEHAPGEPLGAEVAWGLSERLLEFRPECGAQGWAPEFGFGRACRSPKVAGVLVSGDLLRFEGPTNRAVAGPTGRDGDGNVLVQFARMPLGERGGCWYYEARTWRWAWAVDGGAMGQAMGVDLPGFPGCESLLEAELSAYLDDGETEFLPVDAARAIDAVRTGSPGGCGTPLWGLYPRVSGWEGCGPGADTGVQEDGSLVVNWQELHPASDGSVCWMLEPGGGWRRLILEGS